MSTGSAFNPVHKKPHTLSTTPNDPAPCKGFRVTVATPGSLFGRCANTGEVVELPYAAGVFWEPGEYSEIWRDAATIVTNPADIIVLYT